MNHLDQFKRSINIWKLTEGECKKDIYIDMYLFMEDMFKDLNIYTSDEYPLSTYYGTSKDNIILEQDLKNDLNYIIWISEYKIYNKIRDKYKYLIEEKYIIYLIHIYLRNILNLKGNKTLCLPTSWDFYLIYRYR